MDVNIAETSYVGLHRFCKISKQMPPSAYTFGWNIFDTNRTVGGLFGYSSVNSMVNLKVPSSNGVSCGPKITAFHIIMLLSVGAPETPVGGSSCNLWKVNGNWNVDTYSKRMQTFYSVWRNSLWTKNIVLSVLNDLTTNWERETNWRISIKQNALSKPNAALWIIANIYVITNTKHRRTFIYMYIQMQNR